MNGLFLRPYRFTDANGDGIVQTTKLTVDTGVVYRGYSFPRDLVSIQNGFDLFSRKLRVTAMLDYKGGFNLLNNTWQFLCQQAPQACEENEIASTPMWRQARAVANLYGTTVNGTKFTSPGGYWENGQFWRLREVVRVVHAAEHVGEPSARARRELRARRPQPARLDQVHRHRSGSELRDRRRPDGFHHHRTADVLQVPAQPPLLTDEDDFT